MEPLGRIEGEIARAPAVVNRLAYERRAKMTRVRIADGACSRRDWHTVDLLQKAGAPPKQPRALPFPGEEIEHSRIP